MEFRIESRPDPFDIEFLETQIRQEASAVMGVGDEVDLAIFVRDAGTVVAGISGWTWGDGCELQNLWVAPSLRGRGLATRLLAAAEAEAAARGCSQTVHFTYDFQALALYERTGYELVGRVDDFPSGTNVRWYRKRLDRRANERAPIGLSCTTDGVLMPNADSDTSDPVEDEDDGQPAQRASHDGSRAPER